MFDNVDEAWEMLDPVDATHVAVSVTILTNDGPQLQVLMQDNHEGPYTGHFVLPNKIMSEEEMAEVAADELCDSLGLPGTRLEQIGFFSCPRIDPRGRVMNVSFVGTVPRASLGWVIARNDLALIDIEMENGIALLSLGGLTIGTGFLHDEIVAAATERLRKAADYSLAPFAMAGEPFTWAELHAAHEALHGKEITPQFLRKKLGKRVFEGDYMIRGTNVLRRDGPCRPAELFELVHVDPAERQRAQRLAMHKKRMAKRGLGS
jgi:8-oxo-dGTP diphosphatase